MALDSQEEGAIVDNSFWKMILDVNKFGANGQFCPKAVPATGYGLLKHASRRLSVDYQAGGGRVPRGVREPLLKKHCIRSAQCTQHGDIESTKHE